MRTRREIARENGRGVLTPGLSRCRCWLLALLLVICPSLAMGQVPVPAATESTPRDTTATAPQAKSAVTATVLSAFLPGAGHIYAGENRTGWILLGLWAGALAVGVGGENAVSSPVAVVLAAGPWWYGVIDAHRAVARQNRRLGLTVSVLPHVGVPAAPVGASALRVGFAVRVLW